MRLHGARVRRMTRAQSAFGLEAATALGVPTGAVLQDTDRLVDGALTVGRGAGQRLARSEGAGSGARRQACRDGRAGRRRSAPPATSAAASQPLGQRRRLPTVIDESATGSPPCSCRPDGVACEIEVARPIWRGSARLDSPPSPDRTRDPERLVPSGTNGHRSASGRRIHRARCGSDRRANVREHRQHDPRSR